MHVNNTMIQHPSKFVARAQKCTELRTMLESEGIVGESMALQRCIVMQDLAIKIGMDINNTMIQHSFKFYDMSTKTCQIIDNILSETSKNIVKYLCEKGSPLMQMELML